MFDPSGVPFEGGSSLQLNDGGPQHSAGARFLDSIAVPGAAAVSNSAWARLVNGALRNQPPSIMTTAVLVLSTHCHPVNG